MPPVVLGLPSIEDDSPSRCCHTELAIRSTGLSVRAARGSAWASLFMQIRGGRFTSVNSSNMILRVIHWGKFHTMKQSDSARPISVPVPSLPRESWLQVNVVCVTYNNSETVIQLLDSLLVEVKQIAEVVIHDNGSSDSTVGLAKGWQTENPGLPLKIVEASNVGFSGGVFGGSRKLEDQSLPTLCLNPDAILAQGTIDLLLRILRNNSNVGIATAPLLMTDGSMDPSCVRTLPKLGPSILYAILGKLLPKSVRYNGATLEDIKSPMRSQISETAYTEIEATTGALMLVSPNFRSARGPIFDLSYWMYGEDLQLCKDAAEEGYVVAMADCEPSIHIKGVSSGWPRSSKSNKAFYDALHIYYLKNFSRGPVDRFLSKLAVSALLASSEVVGRTARARRSTAG